MLLYTSLFSILILFLFFFNFALSCSLVSQSPPIVLGFTGHPASVQLGEQARAFEYYVWGAGGAGMIGADGMGTDQMRPRARKGGDGDFASGTVWISESRSVEYYTTSIDVFVGEGGWNKLHHLSNSYLGHSCTHAETQKENNRNKTKAQSATQAKHKNETRTRQRSTTKNNKQPNNMSDTSMISTY